MTKRKRSSVTPGEKRGRKTSMQDEAQAQWGEPTDWVEQETVDPAHVQALENELHELQEIRDAVKQGSVVHFGRCQLTPVGLVMPDDLQEDEFAQIGLQLARLDGSLQWMIGDWVAFNEKRQYGDMPAIAEMFDRSEKTLRNYAVVSRAFGTLSRRRDNLSFAHHEVVAKLPTKDADQWLDKAEANGWSREKLRSAIQLNDDGEAKRSSQPLADKTNRIRFNRVWRNIQRDAWDKVALEDVRWLQGWLRQVEEKKLDGQNDG